jgi:hypothetical protein
MNPVHLCISLFLAVLVFTVLAFTFIPHFRTDLKSSYKQIFFILIVAFIAKYPFFQNYFFGLEYEDSYVYDAYARSLLYFQHFSVDPFLTSGCTIGSFNDCQVISTYSGHLITYPSVVYFFIFLFGYSPYTILFFNLSCSIFAAVLIYLLTKLLSGNKVLGLIAATIYSLTPIMNVFQTSGLSETFSSTSVLLFLYLYFSMVNNGHDSKKKLEQIIHWSAIILSFIFASLIKRENLLLITVPIYSLLIPDIKVRFRVLLKRLLPIGFSIFAVLLFYKYYIDLHATINAEMPDVHGFPFSFKFLYILFPIFIRSLLTFKWFALFTPFCFVGILMIFINYKNYKTFLIIFLLFFFYLLLYSSHYRSYYFIKENTATTFETLRYINNLFPFYCMLSALPLFYVYEKFLKKNRTRTISNYSFLAVVFISICLLIQGHSLKKYFSIIEMENRITPVEITLKSLKNNDILVTDEPLLFQIFSDPNFEIINLYSIGKSYPESDLEKLMKYKNIYYLHKPFQDDPIQIERHQESFEIINKYKKTIISHNSYFDLLKLNN